MWSRQTAGRFEKDRSSQAPGPGSYDLPPTLDDKGVATMEGPDRWPENRLALEEGLTNPAVSTSGSDTPLGDERPVEPAAPLALAARRSSVKENRPPSRGKTVMSDRCQMHRAVLSDGQIERDTRLQDRKLMTQLEQTHDEMKHSKEESRHLQKQNAAKDRKVEDLQKRVEELSHERRAAFQRTQEVESERDAKQKIVFEKSQEVTQLQRRNKHLEAAMEDRAKKLERREEDHRSSAGESQRLKASMDALQDKAASAERDRKALEQSLRQQRQKHDQAVQHLQEHISVLEETKKREETRRREFENRAARQTVEQEQGSEELAIERRRGDELQRRVAQLEADEQVAAKALLTDRAERLEEFHRSETELATAKARVLAQQETLERADARRMEVEGRAARAEVAVERLEAELEVQRGRAAEAEEQRLACEQNSGDVAGALGRVEARAAELARELEREGSRCEKAEHRAAQAEAAAAAPRSFECSGLRADEQADQLASRARRAEEELETASEELRRYQDWADAQALRELTIEAQRVEELGRVRQDVARQVDEARRDVVAENQALRSKIQQLEDGAEFKHALAEQAKTLRSFEDERVALDSRCGHAESERVRLSECVRVAQEQVEELTLRAAEERRVLEVQAARAEGAAELAADELAEEQKKCEATVKALRIEYDTATSERNAEFEMQKSVECEMHEKRVAQLEQAYEKSRRCANERRWQVFAEASLSREEAAANDGVWAQVRRAAHRWRVFARGHERDSAMLERQGEELKHYVEELDTVQEEKRQLLQSLQQCQHDLQHSIAETSRLQEHEASYEGDVDRMAERNAQLAGHANPKQKIKHLLALKDENQSLRLDLKRNRQQVSQLEAKLRAASFFEALADEPSTVRPRTPSRRSLAPGREPRTPGVRESREPRTPGARTPGRDDEEPRARPGADPLAALADDRPEAQRRERAEAVRQAKAHRRASERAVGEYQHLAALVERLLAAPAAAAPEAGALQALREALGSSGGACGGGAGAAPEAEARGHVEDGAEDGTETAEAAEAATAS